MKRASHSAFLPLLAAGLLISSAPPPIGSSPAPIGSPLPESVDSRAIPRTAVLEASSDAAGFTLVASAANESVSRADDVEERSRRTDLEHLREEVVRLIQNTGWRSSEWGVLAVSLEHGDTLISMGADRPLAPASNQKLFTSAAALHHLGPDYRFSTYLLSEGEVERGVLRGDLILYGTGDPAISDRLLDSDTRVWRDFARALKDEGVHTISGDVVGDGSYFQGPSRRPSWNPLDLDEWYAAPASALTFAENVVTVRIGGGEPGEPARVRTMPEGARLRVENTSSTISGRPRTSITLSREHPDDPIQIRGHIGTNASEVWRRLTVSDPATYAASVFVQVLESEGIDVEGIPRSIQSQVASSVTREDVIAPAFRSDAPTVRTLATHRSPPLRELVEVLNKRSHNLYAELFLFTLGRVTSGNGSFYGGSMALTDFLVNTAGVREVDLHVEDGSGLSRLNRASPAAFVTLLTAVAASDYAEAFWSSLPEAGNRRELGRMYQTRAAGNLRAKTGTIDRVSALSGFVRTADGEPVLFSIVSNDVPSSWRAKRVEDGIGVQLASFVRTASAEPLDMLEAGETSVSSGGGASSR